MLIWKFGNNRLIHLTKQVCQSLWNIVFAHIFLIAVSTGCNVRENRQINEIRSEIGNKFEKLTILLDHDQKIVEEAEFYGLSDLFIEGALFSN